MELFDQLNLMQRLGLAAIILVTIGGLLWIMLSASTGPYATLYSGLSEPTAGKIVEKLKERNIPYRLDGNGTISVPQRKLYDVRLDMAKEGLPESEGKGFELFNEAEFGMTNFTQKVNYQRALENEIVRTIQHLEQVKDARLHLVMPEETLFEEDRRSPSASVVLTLEAGTIPDQDKIDSIRYLVSSAVEKLEASQVTVVDSSGRLQASSGGSAGASGMGPGGGGAQGLEMQAKIEDNMEKRIVSLLAPVVGREHIRSKVNVELDTAKVDKTVEDYDPTQIAIRSEQTTTKEQSSTEPQAEGAPGAPANLPGDEGAEEEAATSESSKRNKVVNYEIDKTTKQVQENGYEISSLSTAVLIDKSAVTEMVKPEGNQQPGQQGQQGQQGEVEPVEKVTVDQERIASVVKRAVGYNGNRGDKIEVAYQDFKSLRAVDAEPVPWYANPQIIFALLKYAALLALVILVGMLIVRPLSNILEEVTQEEEEGLVGRTVGEVEGEELGAEALAELEGVQTADSPHQRLREEVIEMSQEDIDRTGQVIRQWLRVDEE